MENACWYSAIAALQGQRQCRISLHATEIQAVLNQFIESGVRINGNKKYRIIKEF